MASVPASSTTSSSSNRFRHRAGRDPCLRSGPPGLRLPWPAGTVVYEIDQPEVIEFKTRTLADLGAEPSAQRRTVSVDLRDDWPSTLTQAGLDSSTHSLERRRPAALLTAGRPGRLFDNIAALSHRQQDRTEHLDMRKAPADWADRLTERSRRIGSNINLAELFYTGDRNTAAEYLGARGWRVTSKRHTGFCRHGFELPKDGWPRWARLGYLTASSTASLIAWARSQHSVTSSPLLR